ncbi:hypothetical protein, partial [Streptomyces sp. NRRL S-1868]|uniref:hypothetical protein n=1 Tax=Streptomyces sp. NRRL S-1868 TaxID=1463892 RepID=UPI0018FEAEDA
LFTLALGLFMGPLFAFTLGLALFTGLLRGVLAFLASHPGLVLAAFALAPLLGFPLGLPLVPLPLFTLPL